MNSMPKPISRWKWILLFLHNLIIVSLIEGLVDFQEIKELDHLVMVGNLVEEVLEVGNLVKNGGVYRTG